LDAVLGQPALGDELQNSILSGRCLPDRRFALVRAVSQLND